MSTDMGIIKRRGLPRYVSVGGALGIVLASVSVAQPASAATPSFPDNVVVFPDRDFVSIEGYSEHGGEVATVTVTRPGVGVMGSAKAQVSGTDVAFEINHPGGVCWGNDTNLQVTPDIRAGDVVSISFPDGTEQETTTSSATVATDMTQNGTLITIKGTLGPDVNTAQMEQRVINPDLVELIGRRDIRALPGPMVPAPKGGYSSGMTFPSAGTFEANYQFDSLEAANVAAAADHGERAMSWQVEDADGNRQGLTIAEYGELGGPGMGGCPAGPGEQAAPAGTASTVRSADKTSATVKWTAATAQPGADAVTGYSVEAIDPATGTIRGMRTGPGASQAALSGLDPVVDYTFEVRSLAGTKLSVPFGSTAPDVTAPTLTLTPAAGTEAAPRQAGSVSIASNGQAFYTTDGSSPVTGDMPSDSSAPYTGPIPITRLTELKVASFDDASLMTYDGGFYAPPTVALAPAPTGLASTATTQSSVALSWSSVPGATGYQVTVYDANGAALATQPPLTSVPRQTVSGLSPGTPYGFTVASVNAAGTGPASAPRLNVTTQAATDRITISSARWKTGDFRVVGTGSTVGATVQVHRVAADGTLGTAIAGATAQVVAAAPPGIGDYQIRVRNGAPNTNPGRIYVKSDRGGVAGPFTVSNG